MGNEELLKNRREISLKLCRHIRQNNFQMIKAKNFEERLYFDGENKRKFNTTNYLRLLALERNYSDPRRYKIFKEKIGRWKKMRRRNYWRVTQLTNIPYRNFIMRQEVEKLETEKQTLEEVLDFLIVRDIFETDGEKISLQDGFDAVKNYAAKNFQDELIQILTVQMWLAETKLKTKMELFLPTYSEEVLMTIEKTPESIFQKIQQATNILKCLRKERVKPIAEEINFEELFQGLKIIYHGSEIEIEDNRGLSYPAETILTGVSAYEFLCSWKKQQEKFKTWIE